jgi:MFS transporter, DHA3 family, macrolide efflux protein
MGQNEQIQSYRTFLIISLGQLVSILGTGLTNFAIGIWVYRNTGSVTNFSLTLLAISLPSIIISPFAGALVDRWDRRRTMILGDSVAGLCSFGMAVLLYFERLEVWHVCILIAIAAVAGVFQSLAFTASLPLLIPVEHLSRASGIMEIGPAVARIVAPLVAGALLAWASIYWVLVADFASFFIAVSTTLAVRLPRPEATAEGQAGKGSLWREVAAGWAYIKARPGLVWLLVFFAVINFNISLSDVILLPMWLGIASVQVVGTLAAITSLGMLTGTIVLSIWGGPQRRIHGVLGFTLLLGFSLILMGMSPSIVILAIAGFAFLFAVPFIFGCNQAIWLTKTPPDMQGRVSSMRAMIGWSVSPVAYLIAGPLADKVFEPLLTAGGPLAGSVGKIIGVGSGRGIGLMVIILGIVTLMAVAAGYLNARLWKVEDELQDAMPSEAVEERAETVIGDETPASLQLETQKT